MTHPLKKISWELLYAEKERKDAQMIQVNKLAFYWKKMQKKPLQKRKKNIIKKNELTNCNTTISLKFKTAIYHNSIWLF